MDLKTESQFFKFFTHVNNFYATSNTNNKLVTTFKRLRAKPTLISATVKWPHIGHLMKRSCDFKDGSLLL